MKKVISVLLSVLFCPLSFLGLCALWIGAQRFASGGFGFQWAALAFALGTLVYFLWAGGALSRWSGLRRLHLWLWMTLAGYPLCWAAALLCIPSLLYNGFILIPFFFVTLALAAVWGLWGLGVLLVRFLRVPPREHLRRGGNALAAVWGIAKPMLLAAAVAALFLSVRGLVTMRPAADYEDRGVYTFVAAKTYPTSQKTTTRGRTHTRTVYMLTYQARGASYTYTEEAPSQSAANQYIREKRTVERRVFSIPAEKKYITVDARYPDPEGYVSALRRRYLLLFAAAAACFTAAAVVVIWRKRRSEPAVETAGSRAP